LSDDGQILGEVDGLLRFKVTLVNLSGYVDGPRLKANAGDSAFHALALQFGFAQHRRGKTGTFAALRHGARGLQCVMSRK
jgi:hypothetical protein